jgi:hypothetical protein
MGDPFVLFATQCCGRGGTPCREIVLVIVLREICIWPPLASRAEHGRWRDKDETSRNKTFCD